MGGIGSGRRRWRNAGTVEDCIVLDVNQLNRAGVLRAGWRGTWSLHVEGWLTDEIRIETEPGNLCLRYGWHTIEGELLNIEQVATVIWTPCRYGGQRPYFLCPGEDMHGACRRRVTKLYRKSGYFRRRQCKQLTYRSQAEDQWTRAFRRADAIRKRLGSSPGAATLPDKPKGMHWTTFDRYYRDIIAAEVRGEQKLDRYQRRFAIGSRRTTRRIP